MNMKKILAFVLVFAMVLAFAGCSSLTEINFGYSLTRIEDFAFSGCTMQTTLRRRWILR